ncbi:sensor histidine kinase [Carboxylicivirga sp. M1479]|uniref:sensor histidine kinase n=1 Tax=Carboxylicivirga sp. M1479 TaxID=2594476 RepID=UPI0011785675|nr:ATP-binding protein [Carboxylicivirga sp. M1479]TRX66462.1 hypothetical protein FNN09_13180 [Carboxylicivirga sp. M1479]
MYLNDHLISAESFPLEAFYYIIDNNGKMSSIRENVPWCSAIPDEQRSAKLVPALLDMYKEFLKSEDGPFVKDLTICVKGQLALVECSFVLNEGGACEIKGNIKPQDKLKGSISIDKLPYPIAIVKKDGEISRFNRLFIDFFIDSPVVVMPVYIQDVIKTNVLSPEKFDYLKMTESDANSRAVLCHFKGTENNQTFLLNLIPLELTNDKLYLAAIKDLTQFIEVQQNLEDQNQELRKQVQDEFEINKSYEIKLLQKNRLESLGEIASGIFHELNQPLTHLSLKIDNMIDRWSRGEVDEAYLMSKTEQIQRQISRMRGIIDEMKLFSTVPDRRDDLVNVRKVLNCALEDVRYMQVDGLILVVSHLDDIKINGSENELEQVFVNLLTNSLQSLQLKKAAESGFKPKLKVVFKIEDDLIKIVFIDNGLGVKSEDVENVFKPFFTTKKDIGGTGLGLFIINNLMRKMNGALSVDSIYGKYFKTTLSFPMIKEIDQ